MFSLFGKKDKKEKPQNAIPPVLLAIRETLYSNASLEPLISRIKDDSKTIFPWSNFVEANQAMKKNDNAKAISFLKQVVDAKGLDTRIYLHAWHTLVSLGEMPPETTRGKVQGAVIENHMDHGLDIVAAYADYTARYWNYTGAGIIWDARDTEIDKVIDNLFYVNQEIMKRIGVGLRDMPPIPPKGNIRIFLMAYDGSCVGEGTYDFLYNDEMGKYAISAAYGLMKTLMDKQEQNQK
jgi:hypothetical protein